MQRLEKILAQTAAPKVPEWSSYGNFRKVTQNPYFLKKCKGGTKVLIEDNAISARVLFGLLMEVNFLGDFLKI